MFQSCQKLETVETGKLHLARLQTADAGDYHALMISLRNDPETKKFLSLTTPVLSVDEYAKKLGDSGKPRGCNFAVTCKSSCLFIGVCGFLSSDFGPELYVWLTKESRGHELGPEAAKGLLKAAFLKCNWNVVIGVPHPENIRSIRLLEKIGMQHNASIVDRHSDNSWGSSKHRFPIYYTDKSTWLERTEAVKGASQV